MTAISFEAKKYAYRQSKEGMVVSFLVHPNDIATVFAVSDIGTRYIVALAEIGEDEQPVTEVTETINEADLRNAKAGDVVRIDKKERRRFHALPLSQQAALMCADEEFQRWLMRGTNAADTLNNGEDMSEWAASIVRRKCNITSRSEIKPGTDAAKRWLALVSQFEAATGRQAEDRSA